jgi:hypothetical protein
MTPPSSRAGILEIGILGQQATASVRGERHLRWLPRGYSASNERAVGRFGRGFPVSADSGMGTVASHCRRTPAPGRAEAGVRRNAMTVREAQELVRHLDVEELSGLSSLRHRFRLLCESLYMGGPLLKSTKGGPTARAVELL